MPVVTLRHWTRNLEGFPVYDHHAVQVIAIDSAGAVFRDVDNAGAQVAIPLPLLDYRSDRPLSWVGWDDFARGKRARLVAEKQLTLHVFESRVAALLRDSRPYEAGVKDCETISRFIMDGKAESHQAIATIAVVGIAGLLLLANGE